MLFINRDMLAAKDNETLAIKCVIKKSANNPIKNLSSKLQSMEQQNNKSGFIEKRLGIPIRGGLIESLRDPPFSGKKSVST